MPASDTDTVLLEAVARVAQLPLLLVRAQFPIGLANMDRQIPVAKAVELVIVGILDRLTFVNPTAASLLQRELVEAGIPAAVARGESRHLIFVDQHYVTYTGCAGFWDMRTWQLAPLSRNPQESVAFFLDEIWRRCRETIDVEANPAGSVAGP